MSMMMKIMKMEHLKQFIHHKKIMMQQQKHTKMEIVFIMTVMIKINCDMPMLIFLQIVQNKLQKLNNIFQLNNN